MVVICPKCKVRLKVADEKIGPEGTRFKCPKCGTVLLVKKPAPPAKTLEEKKVLLAHEDPSVAERIRQVLTAHGFTVVAASDGIEAMVRASKELPLLALLSVSLPKIYGFEVSERLRKRPETKDMKILLVSSLYDKSRYRREPSSLHGANGYIEEHQIEEILIEKINELRGMPERKTEEAPQKRGAETVEKPRPMEVKAPGPEKAAERAAAPQPEVKKPAQSEMVEKAKRLARTIVSDIYLYSRAKVEDSIRHDAFHTTFASELKEGMKLYEARIPADIRKTGDFFNEAVNDFISRKKRELP